MPLSPKAKKTLRALQKEYGTKRGTQIFYAMVSEGKIKEKST